MKPFRSVSLTLAACALAAPAFAAGSLTVHVDGVTDGNRIPDNLVMCKPGPEGKNADSKNERPAVSWTAGPEGTKSYAVLVSDPDVPADLSKAYTDKKIDEDDDRQVFYHWAQVDIPATVTELKGSKDAAKLTHGKGVGNDVNQKSPLSYGGPCPPWNDARMHHYHFTVYALDIASLKLPATAHARQAALVLDKHVLAKGEVVGTYTTNPKLLKK